LAHPAEIAAIAAALVASARSFLEVPFRPGRRW